MVLKIYQKYIIKEFTLIVCKITFIFLILGLIMGLLEEINFFSDFDVEYFFPIYLVLLNVPSLIYEIFPFIFLLSSQFLFLKLLENGELNTFKSNGLDNLKILKLITSLSLVVGIFIVIIGDQGLLHQPTEQFLAGGIYPLGEALFSKYLLPFEIASLLLLVALIGTVYLAKRKV